jgi:hypothetical protein
MKKPKSYVIFKTKIYKRKNFSGQKKKCGNSILLESSLCAALGIVPPTPIF